MLYSKAVLVLALHYSHGYTGLAQYAGFVGPALHTKLCRPYTVRRAVQALNYTHGCAVPALYTGLYRPFTIRRAVQVQHCT